MDQRCALGRPSFRIPFKCFILPSTAGHPKTNYHPKHDESRTGRAAAKLVYEELEDGLTDDTVASSGRNGE